ncbi:MAG: HAD family phosphatase [Deltaproteobacteria bacterium]|nr:HAD family phosphatase [Deltaproteobacteria bacterium]
MKYKLLVVDIDGTLLGKERTVSDDNKEALAEARRLGVGVALSTGRAVLACRSILDQLALDGHHIFFDGALISGRGEEIYAEPLDRGVVREAIEFARSLNINFELYSATHYFVERETWSTDAHRKFFGLEPTIVDFTELWERERIIKGGLASVNPEQMAKAREFYKQFESSLHFSWARSPAFPDVEFANVVAREVSKGRALEALVLHLGISLSEVMAVGDGTNDITLLSRAGLAVAMDNAPDEVKAVADHITLDVDQNGLAAAIERFLL